MSDALITALVMLGIVIVGSLLGCTMVPRNTKRNLDGVPRLRGQ